VHDRTGDLKDTLALGNEALC